MTQPPVTMYVSDWCPYCQRAKSLLSKKHVVFSEINIEDDAAMREEMMARSNRSTVPQIFIGDKHVGGCDDLHELEAAGGIRGKVGGQPRLKKRTRGARET